jgi:hypothetical protein
VVTTYTFPGLEVLLAMQAPVHMHTQTQMAIGITMIRTKMVIPTPMAILNPRARLCTIAARREKN